MMKKKHGKQIRSDLRDNLVELLEASTHHILFSRSIYPPSIFKKRLFGPVQFGVPIMVSEHPDINEFICDGLSGLRKILMNDNSANSISQFDLVIIQKGDNGTEYDLEKYMFNFEFPNSKDEDKIFLQPKDVSELEQNMRAALLCLTSRLSELNILNPDTDDPKTDYTFNFRLHTSNEGARAIADDFRWCKAPSSFKKTKLVERSFDDMDTEQTEGFSICDLVEAKSKQLSKPDDSMEEKSKGFDASKETKHEKYLVEPTEEDIELLSMNKIDTSNVVTPVYSFTVPFKLSIMIDHKEE